MPRPTERNINDGCGALHPEVVAAEVVRRGADAGVSHDGDADRALFADADGNVIDGDQVLAACAVGLHDAGELAGDTVVATVMSNIGFERAMTEHGIHLVRTRVGDRYVLEEMDRGGFVLGGEQSGHVIFRRYATTGDGLLTAVRFLSLAAATGATVGELAGVMRRYPQVMINVRVVGSRRGGLLAGRGLRRRDRGRRARGRRPCVASSERHRTAGPGDGRGIERGRRTRTRRGDRRGRGRARLRPPAARARPEALLRSNDMCGIVGYVGPDEALPIVLEGLRRLEYRGYDSAGVAVLGDGLTVHKKRAIV